MPRTQHRGVHPLLSEKLWPTCSSSRYNTHVYCQILAPEVLFAESPEPEHLCYRSAAVAWEIIPPLFLKYSLGLHLSSLTQTLHPFNTQRDRSAQTGDRGIQVRVAHVRNVNMTKEVGDLADVMVHTAQKQYFTFAEDQVSTDSCRRSHCYPISRE